MTSMERIDPAALTPISASGDVRVIVRGAVDAVDSLEPEWIALAETAAEPNAYAEHWFVAASLRALHGGAEVRLLEVRRGEALIGLLPVTVRQGYAHLPVRIVQNWVHDQMFLGMPLVASGDEHAFWTAALEALDGADWAPGLFHICGLTEHGPVHRGLIAARAGLTVHRRVRALLESELTPEAYYARAVRSKKRKEIRRLQNRLAELGPVQARSLDDAGELDTWCSTYLALEKAGWKGEAGSSLAAVAETEAFFREVVTAAWAAGRLQFLRLDVGETCIAMLVNFLTPPGSF